MAIRRKNKRNAIRDWAGSGRGQGLQLTYIYLSLVHLDEASCACLEQEVEAILNQERDGFAYYPPDDPGFVDLAFEDPAEAARFLVAYRTEASGYSESAEHLVPTAICSPDIVLSKLIERIPFDVNRDYAECVLDPSCGTGSFLVQMRLSYG